MAKFFTALLLIFVTPFQAKAIYQGEFADGLHRVNLGGSINAGIWYSDYPDSRLYGEGSDIPWFADLRLLADVMRGDHLRFKANILQSVSRSVFFAPLGSRQAGADVERSGALFIEQHDSGNSRSFLVLDSGYLSVGGPDNLVSLGRQPVSLSVTFYFTPNDFFAPFGARTFYRVYKPGVDALRYERRIGNLSQLTILGVAGYSPEPGSDSGWSGDPEWQRSSLLSRFTAIAGNFEWGVLGGIVREGLVLGGSVQGELFDWLGLRAEGHLAGSGADERADGLRCSLGLEHRFENSLTLRLEQLYNGPGYDSIEEAGAALAAGNPPSGYPGQHYTALDIGYEFGPLLRGELLYIRNWTDDSAALSLYALYSLTNESELALSANFSMGDRPAAGMIRSEFGTLPDTFGLEYRLYF